MVSNKEQILERRNVTSFDAYRDMKRLWPTPLDFDNILCEEQKILEEDDSIENGYKNLLFCLLSTDEISESQNEQRYEDDETTDPESRLFLQHLRPRGELSVLEYEKEGMIVVSQYGEMGSDDECERNLESEGTAEHVINGMIGGVIGQKRGRGRPRKFKNACESIPRSSSVNKKRRKTRNNDPTVVNATVGDLMLRRRFTRSMMWNIGGKNRRKNIHGSKKTDIRRESRNETDSDEAEVVRISLDEYLHLHQNVNLKDGDHHVKNDKVERNNVGPSPFKNRSSSMRKSRNVPPQNLEIVKCSYRDFMIAKNSKVKEQKREKMRKLSEASKQMPRVGNQPKRGRGRPRKTFQTGTSSAVRNSRNVTEEIKIEGNQPKRGCGRPPKTFQTGTSSAVRHSRNVTEEIKIEKCSSNESMNAKARDRVNEINIKKEVEDESIPEDLPACFVPSKRFDRDIVGDNSKQRGRSSASNEFRKQVLSVLGKPFDKDEYTRRTKAFKDGNYLVYYPDVKKKLCKYQYKRAKRMTVLRGFFFYLQNVTQEGAFKPWKDRECLDVVLGSPVKPSTKI